MHNKNVCTTDAQRGHPSLKLVTAAYFEIHSPWIKF